MAFSADPFPLCMALPYLNDSERWKIIRPHEARKAGTGEDGLPGEYSTHKLLPKGRIIDRRVGRICQLCLYQFVHHLPSVLLSPLYKPPYFLD